MVIRAILTDIEGTTSSIRFVKEVLFPYAAQEIPDFLRQRQAQPEVAALIGATATEANLPTADLEGVIEQLLAWIACDRKSTALKAIQGLVWAAGYQDGSYRGHVYADAQQRLQAWHQQGLELYVYSSGSVQAQKLLFGYSDYGDLTPCFQGYFDTTVGPKQARESYEKIAQAIARPAQEILFLSDATAELEGAIAAGYQVCWLVRPEDCNASPDAIRQAPYPTARSFAEINLP
ncbi:MAG: acireductone synthase [Synechococcales cyanobacterium CRU_2_2]|nr:acireductone synthase [Synechococcales cyanobacterium CRU_2_2]